MSLINTYLNIPDCKNKESLFEAEMHRARNHLKNLKELGDHEFSFIVMDEIFSSTNPEEGISGAYAICNKLAEYKNSISVITTHFNYLTKLENSGNYKNYKIPIERNEHNEIVYPYKLQEGASDQHIALELLKKKGFDSDIVDDAILVCEKLKLSNHQDKNEDKHKETSSEDGDGDGEKKETISEGDNEKKEAISEGDNGDEIEENIDIEEEDVNGEKKEEEKEDNSEQPDSKD